MCSFDGCQKELVLTDPGGYFVYDIGEVAHIVAHSPAGPRGPSTGDSKQSIRESNLILFCPTHHTLVDSAPQTYTVEVLRQMKARHERFVQDAFQRAMLNVTLVEIETVAQHLIAQPISGAIDFRVIPPTEKLSRNALTEWPKEQLTLGIPRSREVGRYLASTARTDPEFPEKVKAGFIGEYHRLWASGLRGDELFQGMYRYATGGTNDYKRIVAGVAILAYLFEACEVFES
jgi:hypothetical protein